MAAASLRTLLLDLKKELPLNLTNKFSDRINDGLRQIDILVGTKSAPKTIAELKQESSERFKAGDFMSALKLCDEAIEIEPKEATHYGNRSLALLRLGRVKEAVTDGGKAVSLAPTWSRGHYRLGMALLGDLGIEGAIASLETSFHLDPGNTTVQKALADARALLKTDQSVSSRSNPGVDGAIRDDDAGDGKLDTAATSTHAISITTSLSEPSVEASVPTTDTSNEVADAPPGPSEATSSLEGMLADDIAPMKAVVGAIPKPVQLPWLAECTKSWPLRLVESEGAGRYFVAARPIKKGDLILREEPIAAAVSAR